MDTVFGRLSRCFWHGVSVELEKNVVFDRSPVLIAALDYSSGMRKLNGFAYNDILTRLIK